MSRSERSGFGLAYSLFKEIDTAGAGKISLDNVRSFLLLSLGHPERRLSLQRLGLLSEEGQIVADAVERLDLDASGTLTAAEFQFALLRHQFLVRSALTNCSTVHIPLDRYSNDMYCTVCIGREGATTAGHF